MLFDSVSRLAEKRSDLSHEEKKWLVNTINNILTLEGKEKLYALLIVYNKHQSEIYDPKEPFYDIDKIDVKLQIIWFEFTQMYLKSQRERRKGPN